MESTPSSVCGFGPVRAHVRMNGTRSGRIGKDREELSGHTSFLLEELARRTFSKNFLEELSGHTSFLLDEKDQVPAGWRQTGKMDETAMETDALDARMYLRPPCMLFEYKFV